ncbi:hypothetical protein GCM10022419_060850 [Nonomuraea rosea]|uniref:HTH lysR-type domain-containing protein n=1 Tax=Nonomuraea rosea TaxID=638574 RepID=A0ABP6XXX6_9ACTN
MTFTQLRILRAVARAGSMTRAAEELATTQSAVSHALRALEAELGLTLLIRGNHGVRLTSAGQAVYRRAALILTQVEALEQEVAGARGQDGGSLRVGVIPSANARLLPRILRAFGAAHPRVRLTVIEGSDQEVLEWLSTGAADLATVTAPVAASGFGPTTAPVAASGFDPGTAPGFGPVTDSGAAPGFASGTAAGPVTGSAARIAVGPAASSAGVGLVTSPLARDRLLAIVPSGHDLAVCSAVSISDLARHPFVMSTGGCEPLIMALARAAGVSLRCHYRVRDTNSILAMVAEGLGVSIMPELSLPAHHAGVAAIPLDPAAERTILLALPEDPLPAAIAFAALATELIGGEPTGLAAPPTTGSAPAAGSAAPASTGPAAPASTGRVATPPTGPTAGAVGGAGGGGG